MATSYGETRKTPNVALVHKKNRLFVVSIRHRISLFLLQNNDNRHNTQYFQQQVLMAR